MPDTPAEPGGLPAAGGAAAGHRLPAGPARRAAVAGHAVPATTWPSRRTRARAPARPPCCGRCTTRSGPATWSSPTPCSTTTSWSASCASAASTWSPAPSAERVGSQTVESRPDGDIIVWQRPNKPRGMSGEQYRTLPQEPAHAAGERRCPRQGQPRRAVQGRHHDPRRVDRRRADRRAVRAEVGGGGRYPLDQVDDEDGRPALQDARRWCARRSGRTCWRTTCSARSWPSPRPSEQYAERCTKKKKKRNCRNPDLNRACCQLLSASSTVQFWPGSAIHLQRHSERLPAGMGAATAHGPPVASLLGHQVSILNH